MNNLEGFELIEEKGHENYIISSIQEELIPLPAKLSIINKLTNNSIVVKSINDILESTSLLDTNNMRIWPNVKLRFSRVGGAGTVDNDDNWGIQLLNVKKLWDMGIRGEDVKVGIADSGININHPTFDRMKSKGKLKRFSEFDQNGNKVHDFDLGTDINIEKIEAMKAKFYHGTFCSSILAGDSTNGKLRGAAPDVDLYVTKILDNDGEGSVASFKAGFNWLLEQNCDIVSLSLQWPGKHEEWADEISNLIDSGCIVVAASGNSFRGGKPSASPGNYPISKLISVGAIDDEGLIWEKSCRENVDWPDEIEVDLGAGNIQTVQSIFQPPGKITVPTVVSPGTRIISAAFDDSFLTQSGTSFATPIVAGILALILSHIRKSDNRISPSEASKILLNSLNDLGVEGQDLIFGFGTINIDKILANLALPV